MKKKRSAISLEGRQPSLYTRRVEAYMPPTLSPFRLFLDGSAFFINHHRLSATVYRLLPPTTGFHRLRHLARQLSASTAFRHLARLCAVTEMRDVPSRCQLCGMARVSFRRWCFLDTKRCRHEGGFCHSRWVTLPARAGSPEVTGCSAPRTETSASAFLADALPFSSFQGCREIHGGRAKIGRVAGDMGGQ